MLPLDLGGHEQQHIFKRNSAKECHIVLYSVAISVLLRADGGREGVIVDDFCQARQEENTDSRMNSAVKYATARGRLA